MNRQFLGQPGHLKYPPDRLGLSAARDGEGAALLVRRAPCLQQRAKNRGIDERGSAEIDEERLASVRGAPQRLTNSGNRPQVVLTRQDDDLDAIAR
jgi:hypothetical protein